MSETRVDHASDSVAVSINVHTNYGRDCRWQLLTIRPEGQRPVTYLELISKGSSVLTVFLDPDQVADLVSAIGQWQVENHIGWQVFVKAIKEIAPA